MSLSVCVRPQCAPAAVEALGALADEVVVADWAGDPAGALGRCTAAWILWLDEHEQASEALLARLPELVGRDDVVQYCVARAWLFGDEEHRLAGAPWSQDFPNLLTRRGTPPRSAGPTHRHADRQRPFEYVEEPVLTHRLLALDAAARRDEAIVQEAVRPGLWAPGGGRLAHAFLLPERRGDPPVAPRDAPVDRTRAGASAGAAEQVLVRVANGTTDVWPAALDADPPIRLAHRWVSEDGSSSIEGPRTAFPRPVEPGEEVLAAVDVVAPEPPARRRLQVDVVHEHVRWLGCGTEVLVDVGDADPSPADRWPPSPAPPLRRLRRLRIPRTIHRIWLGDAPMPVSDVAWGESVAAHHPDWEMRLWSDADVGDLGISAAEREAARSPAELANLLRYVILHREGGVYVDTDVESLRPLDPLLRGIDGFAALEVPGRVCNAILGSVPGHEAFAQAARCARRTLGRGPNNATANGPYMLSLVLEDAPDVAIFPAALMYPFRWDEPEVPARDLPDAYTIHHWNKSWTAVEAAGPVSPA